MTNAADNSCIVCGSAHSDLLFETTYPEHAYPGTFAMRRCRGCARLFHSPPLPAETAAAFYAREYYFFLRNLDAEFRRTADIYRRTVALVHDRIHERRVLEIGGARGCLLAILRHGGWKTQGVELSADAAHYADTVLGVPTFAGAVEGYAARAGVQPFPLVLAIDVLEHVTNPVGWCRAVSELTEDGGYLVIDTPNADAANIETERADWPGFNPFHINIFSKRAIAELLTERGYSVERLFSYGNTPRPEPPSSWKRRLLRHPFLRSRLALRLRLADRGRVAFQRVRSLLGGRVNVTHSLAAAVTAATRPGSYLDMPDAAGPLANDCRGDNIVVIARKERRNGR
ncbi:MAG: class I SAM-dependent methyltransferase [Kiritimatiellae bacterium]|nr:class I SAM-dependent methyltransferase [Kiritimatiellia bacterium]